MIKVAYGSDNCSIEATFETLEEMAKFQKEFKERSEAMAREAEEKRLAEEQAKKEAEEKQLMELKEKYEKVASHFKEALVAARDFGMTPEGAVELMYKTFKDMICSEEAAKKIPVKDED